MSLKIWEKALTCLWILAPAFACAPPSEEAALAQASPSASAPLVEAASAERPLAAAPAGAPRRRALLVGINDYSADGLSAPKPAADAEKVSEGQRQSWPDLAGAVNDVEALRDMLVGRFGFQDVRLLKDQEATRDAILRAIEKHLVKPAQEGDLVVFHYSGHGSQVRNTKSRERDKLDESFVPADSRLGARDIRDKELRGLFNQVLAKKARLVVILDSCHSGSGVRGLPDGSPARGIRPDLRDVVDGKDYGPLIEQAGALVLSAAQDDEEAIEGRDEKGRSHGVFTLALLRALRAAPAGESSRYVFERVRAWLGAAGRFQRPVLEGRPERLAEPLFGPPGAGHDGAVVAVDRVGENGQVSLLGGWIDGLAVGSELRALHGEADAGPRLRVTDLDGLQRSRAELLPADGSDPPVERGQLFKLVSWVAEQQPLRVWAPRTEAMDAARRLAEDLAASARRGDIGWIEDPTEATPSHVVRWSGNGFELLGPEGPAKPLGTQPSASRVAGLLPAEARLFVQLPAPAVLRDELKIGSGSRNSAVETVDDPRRATYILAGRLRGNAVEYAWIRPGSVQEDQDDMHLPVRSKWLPLPPGGAEEVRETAWDLQERILRLYKVFSWNLLQSPPRGKTTFPHRLAIAQGGALVGDQRLYSGRDYTLVLKTQDGAAVDTRRLEDRYVYVFAIDSAGASSLLYPQSSLASENKYPGASAEDGKAPGQIDLGADSLFDVIEPFGFDTFFLLTSTEPIDDPWLVFQYESVRGKEPQRGNALATLLAEVGSTRRGFRSLATGFTWSIERVSYQTVAAGD